MSYLNDTRHFKLLKEATSELSDLSKTINKCNLEEKYIRKLLK